MKQRLCIGIQKRTTEWEAVLNHLGVWFEEVIYSAEMAQRYSLIILNARSDQHQKEALRSYLKDEGSILEIKDNLTFISKSDTTPSFKKTVVNDDDTNLITSTSFLDIHADVRLHKQSELFEGLIHFKSSRNQNIGFFGADVASLIQQTGYKRKRFYSEVGAAPDEIVNQVSKSKLLSVFNEALKELHLRQGHPYVTKWTSPTTKPVFCFRIDSDFGDQDSIEALYKVINKHQISATWFLHVAAHEDWLDDFKKFENQEIALHGYEHGTSSSFRKTQTNIETGKEKLEAAGFGFDGFCAPYGIWNKALNKSLTESDFSYSSEFTFAYDGHPVQPIGKKLPLQIPIHPICTGSMRRRKYSSNDMMDYFEQVLLEKTSRFEPVLFYHHPLQPGLEVLDKVFSLVKSHQLKNLTFSEYAAFWKSRNTFTFEAYLDNGKVVFENSSDPDKIIQVATERNTFDLITTSDGNLDLTKTSKFKYSNSYLLKPEQIKRLRTRDLRHIKTSLWDWKNRIRL
jgi:peptidoglycan/xylan/chitin deacetylase (PgdA/CDA1 family)